MRRGVEFIIPASNEGGVKPKFQFRTQHSVTCTLARLLMRRAGTARPVDTCYACVTGEPYRVDLVRDG